MRHIPTAHLNRKANTLTPTSFTPATPLPLLSGAVDDVVVSALDAAAGAAPFRTVGVAGNRRPVPLPPLLLPPPKFGIGGGGGGVNVPFMRLPLLVPPPPLQ